MSESGIYKIRPAGRHILTIGRDLIQDCYAAVVELVKNAYDADSPDVNIEFRGKPNHSVYSIIISDHGHGMSRDTVIHNWMVPSTRDKLDRRVSPSGRVMQGRKGVGRYAASILGTVMLLETVTPEGEKTSVLLEWDNFEDARYLDEVDILIETSQVSEHSGTRLNITSEGNRLPEWDKKQLDKLEFELKKMISPVNAVINDDQRNDEFQISLTFNDFLGIQDITKIIEPYPIFDFFDYRITGKINANGDGVLIYSLQKACNTPKEYIQFKSDIPTGCGELVYDIRVYDREKEAIESLIQRGLKNDSGHYLGELQARQLLNDYNGIGVYRNGFRIRPLGDADFDWLKLNEQRVQNPSLRIGSNQVIGYVQIQSDELSGIVEKSARDGLKDNTAFTRLKEITKNVIAELEKRRFDYRKRTGLSRYSFKVEQELEQLFSFDFMKRDIQVKLVKSGMDKTIADEIIEIINSDAENKNKIAEELRQAVAVYQGQATLGKIINVILHEGRRPLSYFRNQIPRIGRLGAEVMKSNDFELLAELIKITDDIGNNAEIFVKLFNRLDPLAAGKRSARKPLHLAKTIKDTLGVFEEEMKNHNVVASVVGPDDFIFLSWLQDIYSIFTNLIDNSLYWLNEKNISDKKIMIEVVTDRETLLYIDYRDTGPGIEPYLIASGVIFEPQFSTKPSGTGLGLAIAGESATRNGLELKAYQSDKGAYFRLQPKEGNNVQF